MPSNQIERKTWRDFLLPFERAELDAAERKFAAEPTEANYAAAAKLSRGLQWKGYNRQPFDAEVRYPVMPGIYNTVKIGRAEWEKINRVDYETIIRLKEVDDLAKLLEHRLGLMPDALRYFFDERRAALEENRERIIPPDLDLAIPASP